MIRTGLKGIAVLLGVTIAVLLGFYLHRSDPWGQIPGRRLLGEEAARPVEDWSFAEEARIVALEVRPSDPYSVYASCLVHDGHFYSLATSIENRWVGFLMENPEIRFRVGDRIYRGRAFVVEDPELIDDLFETLARKYRGGRDRTPEQRARYRFIRIESR